MSDIPLPKTSSKLHRSVMAVQTYLAQLGRTNWERLGWGLLIVLTLCSVGLFVAGIPAAFTAYQPPCPAGRDLCYGHLDAANYLHRDVSPSDHAILLILRQLMVFVVYGTIAVLLLWKAFHNVMARFVSLFLLQFVTIIHADTPYTLFTAAPWIEWPLIILQMLSFTSLSLFIYIFPDGRFVPGWTRWLYSITITTFFVFALTPGIPYVNIVEGISIVGVLGVGVGLQIYRYRRVATPQQQRQIRWVMFGLPLASVGALGVGVLFIDRDVLMPTQAGTWAFYLQDFIWGGFFMILPLSLAIAIGRERLWNIDVLVNRALVYGLLTVGVGSLYVLAVGASGRLFQNESSTVIAIVWVGLMAIAFHPLQKYLQQAVNRLMYGERQDPYTVLTQLGEQLETTHTADTMLMNIVTTIRRTLKLSYAAVAFKHDDSFTTAAADGVRPDDPLYVPLIYQGETIGQFILGPRTRGEVFSPADQELIGNLARQAGVAVHAVRLTNDLQQAREQLVLAREEERRRLRRDLHDGLGPALAAQTLKVGTARTLLKYDPVAAEHILETLETDHQTALNDIRQLVYNLRPPTLDELGLVGAIRNGILTKELTDDTSQDAIRLRIDAPATLPPLPAAVEVAAFRIIQEAVTNVIRHAQAHQCIIRLSLCDRTLQLEIIDDGMGMPDKVVSGIGFQSMRERARELGGTWSILPNPNGGTRVCARLPFSSL